MCVKFDICAVNVYRKTSISCGYHYDPPPLPQRNTREHSSQMVFPLTYVPSSEKGGAKHSTYKHVRSWQPLSVQQNKVLTDKISLPALQWWLCKLLRLNLGHQNAQKPKQGRKPRPSHLRSNSSTTPGKSSFHVHTNDPGTRCQPTLKSIPPPISMFCSNGKHSVNSMSKY